MGKHISVGKRESSLEMLVEYAKQDSLPFAVIPPERMGSEQLCQALKDRRMDQDACRSQDKFYDGRRGGHSKE